MKRIITYFSIFAALLAVSCNRIETSDFSSEAGFVRFVLESSEMETRTVTSAAADFVDNEGLVKRVDYFFFKKSDGTMLIEHGFKNFADTDTEYVLEFSTADGSGHEDLRKPFYAYFLVNYSTGKHIEGEGDEAHEVIDYLDHSSDDWTLEGLQALPISTDFLPKNGPIPDFVMDSGNKLVYVKAATQGGAVEQTISLEHIAAKLILNFSVSSSLQALGDTWTPVVDQSTVRFWNALNTTTVKGEPVERTATSPKGNYFNYADEKPLENGTSWKTRFFYTYPQLYGTTKDGKIVYNNGEPYFKITMVWNGANQGATRFYYKILIKDLEKIERNKYYVLNLVIDKLGGVEDEYVQLTDNYYVAEWKDPGAISQSGATAARFLDIALPSYSFYGLDEMNVPVVSSHPISVSVGSDSNYNNGYGIKKTFKSGVSNQVSQDSGYPKTNENKDFTLKHKLVTDVTKSDYDCGIITYKVKVWHTDDPSTFKTVTIYQYPPVYIEEETSNGYAFVNRTSSSYGSAGQSCRNNSNSNDNNVRGIGSLPERRDITGAETGNVNRHQYTVYVSVLPSNYSFVIGDPRATEKGGVSNLGGQISSNYRRTASNSQNVIAPAFKMASSYGKTNDLIFERAEERCAAYQENGYPAGRWRVPTVAEIQFCIDLYEQGHIPELYHTGHKSGYSNTYRIFDTYWAGGKYAYAGSVYKAESGADVAENLSSATTPSSGVVYSKTVNNRTYYYSSAVRCVYDVWYWGENPLDNNGNEIPKTENSTNNATQWLGYTHMD